MGVYIEIFLPLVIYVHFMVVSDNSFEDLLEGSGDIFNFILMLVGVTICFFIPILFSISVVRKNVDDRSNSETSQIVLDIGFENLDIDKKAGQFGSYYNVL